MQNIILIKNIVRKGLKIQKLFYLELKFWIINA